MKPDRTTFPRQTTGLTLIEVLVVVAIVGILAVVALPSFREMLIERRLKGAAEAVQADLMFARSEAVRRNAPIHVLVATGANGCLGLNTTACTSCRPPESGGNCSVKALNLSPADGDFPGVQVAEVSATAFQITAVRGTPSVASPSVTVATTSGAERRIRVSLSPLGMATLCTLAGKVSGVANC